MKVVFEPLYPDVKTPVRSHLNDAAADAFMPKDTIIKHGKNMIPMGFKCVLPPGVCALFTPRSSFMDRLVNSAVPVDAQYSGEWHLCINNMGEEFVAKKGERIAQIMVIPVVDVDFVTKEDYEQHSRAEGGLGSTGK